jgi:2-polyprenyl-3-methyl-5-hydroxy-6-metoxy-1,4-benzoquinol methylase
MSTGGPRREHRAQLARVSELESAPFRAFMCLQNTLAQSMKLRQFTNWSKVWEYPWLWFNALAHVHWPGTRLVDIGAELSPFPWFAAMLGARVTLVETDAQWVPHWTELRERTAVHIQWSIVSNESLPLDARSADVVTSFSVIEHQPDKQAAIAEVARVLRPGGVFAVSFDVCEPALGMSFPEWNGTALTLAQAESLLLHNPAFDGPAPRDPPGRHSWNVEDAPEFIEWHLRSAPHHRYTVGAAALVRAG